MKRLAFLAVVLVGCASRLDGPMTAQNLANVQTIAADNAALATQAKLDPASVKVYADHAAAAVRLAKTMADGVK